MKKGTYLFKYRYVPEINKSMISQKITVLVP